MPVPAAVARGEEVGQAAALQQGLWGGRGKQLLAPNDDKVISYEEDKI